MQLQLRVFARTLRRLLGGLVRRDVALLHLHSASRSSFWRKSLLAVCARCFGVPYFFHIHSGERVQHYHERWPWWQRAWARQCLHDADRVLLLTAGWQRTFEREFPGLRCAVTRNPVAVGSTLPTAGPPERLLFLGRLTELKGAWDLLRALPAVLQRHPGVHLVMAGPGDEEAARALVRQLGLPAGAVSFPGWVAGEAKQAALRAAGVFVLPSHAEALPISMLEAMAGGLVVVATAVGGVPELIDHGRNGLLVPCGDSAALASALLQVIEDPARRTAMREAAFRRVQWHALPEVVQEMNALYRAAGVET